MFIEPTEFGWNVYFDPKHSIGKNDKTILLQEEKPTVSPSKQTTSVFKEAKSSSDEDSEDSNFGNLQKILIRLIYMYLYDHMF